MHQLKIGDLIEEGGAFADIERRRNEALRDMLAEYGRWRRGAVELAHHQGIPMERVFRALDAGATLTEHGQPEAEQRFRELLEPGEHAGKPHAEAGDDWTPTPPSREWLIPDWLPAGRIGALAGEGKKGKSRLALQLAAAIAAGEDAWLPGCSARLALPGPATAVIASWEDERDEVARKLHGMTTTKRVPMTKAVGNLLRFVAPDGMLWEPKRGGSGHPSTTGELAPAGAWLRRYCEDRKARLLVVDPRAAAFGLNENDRALVRMFNADWDQWAQRTGCAVMLVTHPPKSEAAYSGSTDWQAAPRFFWNLEDGDTGTGDVAQDGKKGAKDAAPSTYLECLFTSYGIKPERQWLRGYPAWAAVSAKDAADWRAQLSRGVGNSNSNNPSGANPYAP